MSTRESDIALGELQYSISLDYPHTRRYAFLVPQRDWNPNRKDEAMTRNLKAFGLALVAMLAIGAFAAQGASAAEEHSFRSAANQTVLTGQNESYGTGSSRDRFTATAGLAIECDSTFEGTNTGAETDTVRVRPTYSSCAGGVTVHNNGCEYVFDSDTEQASGHSTSSEHATVRLDCGANHEHSIEITRPGCNIAFSTTHNSTGTTVNQSLSGVRYANTSHSSNSTITVTATAKTIRYIVTAGSFCGLAGHAAGTYSNGTYDGLASVTGYTHSTGGSGTMTTGRTWTHSSQSNISISTPT
jgi:hypothetical protein